jgi:hypothetical protein
MKMYYFRAERGNFGDDLNPWLWGRLLGDDFFDEDDQEIFVGIGTLLNHRIPKAKRVIVFGSGHGYGSKPNIDDGWDFLCVRGPKTAEFLGLPPSCAIADPAILICDHLGGKVQPKSGRIGFIPHCDSAELGDWREICFLAGYEYIDPHWHVDQVIEKIGHCERVVTEAMHGAIFADAMRVPWLPVAAYGHISTFKWQDWCMSMELQYAPCSLPSIWRGDDHLSWRTRGKQSLKRLFRKLGVWRQSWDFPPPVRSSTQTRDIAVQALKCFVGQDDRFQLSDSAVFSTRVAQLKERLALLKVRY